MQAAHPATRPLAPTPRRPPGRPTVTRPARRIRPAAAASAAGTTARAPAGTTLDLFSPSKINLFLRVVARRPDGFHDLASLFHVIDLGDGLTVEALGEGATADELVCEAEGVPTDGTNLVMKAFALFRAKTGDARHYRAVLTKHVPHGAGLGGGSANAATALWAANELSGRPATDAQLGEWAGDIGSDISVFFSSGCAYCTGRGEIVEDTPPPLPLGTPLLLAKPPAGLATPAVFKALDLASRSTADPLALLAGLASARRATPALCVNDLEPPAFSIMPELKQVKERLGKGDGVDAAFMTGSGSTMIAFGGDGRPPAWLTADEATYGDWFVATARLVGREAGGWYERPKEG